MCTITAIPTASQIRPRDDFEGEASVVLEEV